MVRTPGSFHLGSEPIHSGQPSSSLYRRRCLETARTTLRICDRDLCDRVGQRNLCGVTFHCHFSVTHWQVVCGLCSRSALRAVGDGQTSSSDNSQISPDLETV